MSSDVRHRMRHALEIGPRRNNLSYYTHTSYASQVGERRMDRRERKEGDSGNRVMSIAIYRSTLFPASGGKSNRERDEYRRYFPLQYHYHPPFNDQARDRLLVVRDVRPSI